MTPRLPELAGLEDAEEIFQAFQVGYDARILRTYRLHVLRRFGLCLEAFLAERPRSTPGERRAAIRRLLRDAHDTFTRSTPREEQVFRVHGAADLVPLGRRK